MFPQVVQRHYSSGSIGLEVGLGLLGPSRERHFRLQHKTATAAKIKKSAKSEPVVTNTRQNRLHYDSIKWQTTGFSDQNG